jgi:PAS domain S-box-containing protein
MKILAIDDNQDNLTALQAVVRDALPGCVLATALNGPQGLDLARAEDPDVILLDIVMPDMDGFEVCRRLKADETLRSIPVVFATSLGTDRTCRVKALEVGAEAFLSKPLDELELVAGIRAMTKLKAAHRLQRLEQEQLASLVAERTRELELELADRKQAEEAAKREHVLSKAIIDSIPGTFYMLDEQGRYVRWNTYQRDEIVGMPEDSVGGTNAIDTIHPDDRALIASRIANVLGSSSPETVEGRVLLRGGPAFRWLLMTGRQMVVDGHPFLVGIGIDITARKEAEEHIQSQLVELQRWQAVMIERADRSMKLKREVNELCHRLGEPPRYPSQADRTGNPGT